MEFLQEATISGFISKIISDCLDISLIKIKEADKNRKLKAQSIQTRIYQVIIDAINRLTFNKYKGRDELYDSAQILLNELKNENHSRIESIRNGLKILDFNVDNNECRRFMELLLEEIGKEANFDLYKQILLAALENVARYSQSEFQQIKFLLQQINEKLERDENELGIQKTSMRQMKYSKTQNYLDKWNKNMFLNDFDEWDEKPGVNVKLSDVYLDEHLPHFIWGQNTKESTDLKEFLKKYIEKHYENKMLLILGQPGIGKSTLITWITANFTERIDDILVYQFASDLKTIDWKNTNVHLDILDVLNLSYNDLEGKTLILDGFDELGMLVDRRTILDNLYGGLIYQRNTKNFSLIITCRENYIQGFERVKCNYIHLKPWNKMQIDSFSNIFQEKTKNDLSKGTIEKLVESKEIFGIPLILYMVLSLNISIEKEGSIVDVYDKIFSLEGGIYDRCIDYKRFEDPHRISEIKSQIHQISRDIAIWMFENNPNEAYILQEEYKKICVKIAHETGQNAKNIEQDFLIGNFYKIKHCEGGEGEELYFVHRSIYEYFVMDSIYGSIENSIKNFSVPNQENLVGNISVYLKQGEITQTIGEYLQYKIIKLYLTLDAKRQDEFYTCWEQSIIKMINNGMFYYTNKKVDYYKNIINKECRCFENLLKILRLLFKTSKKNYIFEQLDRTGIEKYIKHSLIECTEGRIRYDLSKMSLTGIDLSRTDLRNVNLQEVDLSGANLSESDLSGTCLSSTKLKDADMHSTKLIETNLEGVDLRGVKIQEVDLTVANIGNAIFDEEQVEYLSEEYNLNFTNVYIKETGDILTYKDYLKYKYNC